MTAPSIRAELAAAIRVVNAARARVPEQIRPDVDASRWRELLADLDLAGAKGDSTTVLTAIEEWQESELAHLAAAADQAMPLAEVAR